VYDLKHGSKNNCDPGANGAMGTITPGTHDIYAQYLVSQSFNVNMPKGNLIREWVDGADVPSIALPGRKEGASINFRLERVSNALMVLFFNGTAAGTAPEKYSHPYNRQAIYKSMAITAGTANGLQFYWEIPYGLLSSGLVGNPSLDAEGKVEIDTTFEVLVPIDGSGNPLDVWDSWDLNDT
jgi:hypothetical protein